MEKKSSIQKAFDKWREKSKMGNLPVGFSWIRQATFDAFLKGIQYSLDQLEPSDKRRKTAKKGK